MTLSSPHRTAVLVVGGLLLAGCSSDPSPATTNTPSTPTPTSSSASASPSPTPTSTLTAAQQQAVDEAAAVVLAREQLIVDLLADPDPRLNDLNNLVAQPQLERDINNTRNLIGARETVVASTGPITVAEVEPVKVDLKGDPPIVVLEVCVDSTATNGTYKGDAWTGPRERLRYQVVKTTYLPEPGWAVTGVQPPKGYDQPQPC